VKPGDQCRAPAGRPSGTGALGREKKKVLPGECARQSGEFVEGTRGTTRKQVVVGKRG